MTTTKTRGGGDPGRITTEHRGDLFLIAIARPAKMNGFSPKMLDELAAAYSSYERTDEARCAVVHAVGDHFTAGLDLALVEPRARLLPAGMIDPLGLRPPLRTKPVVMAVKGVCYTIGIELMLAADVVVAARDTRFAQLEVKRGLLAFGGAPIRMVQAAGWGNAMRYLLTGDEFDAETALRFGFVQDVVEPGAELDRALAIAETIAAQAPLAVKATIEAARLALLEGPRATIEADPDRVARLTATADFKEGVASFKERRVPVFKGK